MFCSVAGPAEWGHGHQCIAQPWRGELGSATMCRLVVRVKAATTWGFPAEHHTASDNPPTSPQFRHSHVRRRWTGLRLLCSKCSTPRWAVCSDTFFFVLSYLCHRNCSMALAITLTLTLAWTACVGYWLWCTGTPHNTGEDFRPGRPAITYNKNIITSSLIHH